MSKLTTGQASHKTCAQQTRYTIVQVALPVPVHRCFDYLLQGPARQNKGQQELLEMEHESETAQTVIDLTRVQAGCRVLVRFRKKKLLGVITGIRQQSQLPDMHLNTVVEVLDQIPILGQALMEQLLWAAQYYQYPVGEVVQHALPALLRKGQSPQALTEPVWRLEHDVPDDCLELLVRAPRQRELMRQLQQQVLSSQQLSDRFDNWQPAMTKLQHRGWVCRELRQLSFDEVFLEQFSHLEQADATDVTLNPEQQTAVQSVCQHLGAYKGFLLDGVTGSGKTQVYLEIIKQVIARGEQAMVLVPEIGLTPQTLARFYQYFKQSIALLHSGLSDHQRLLAWDAVSSGKASILIGTRSAVFTPLARPGVIIVDEEHDTSFKQQEGFRYSARDFAIRRASCEAIPIVLGSATPSLESLANVAAKRLQSLHLRQRAARAATPKIEVVDARSQYLQEGIAPSVLQMMGQYLARGEQVLLFINRRGFAPTLMCHDCGWVAQCRRCDSHMTVHRASNTLRCHHCGSQRPLDSQCPECQHEELLYVGQGTERIEQFLSEYFENTGIARIDRDSTRRKGALDKVLAAINKGDKQLLVGTQMLAKGHHFPNVTLVVILNIDQGLFSADFRGPERMAQLITQVAGRAGRGDKAGRVLIQTHHPDHPLLQTLLIQDYGHFAQLALAEREAAGLPPYQFLALLRAQATDAQLPLQFLLQVKNNLQDQLQKLGADAPACHILGPVPAPMERRGGHYRAQLLLQAAQRAHLHRALSMLQLQLEQVPLAKKVRWSLDVDPIDMF